MHPSSRSSLSSLSSLASIPRAFPLVALFVLASACSSSPTSSTTPPASGGNGSSSTANTPSTGDDDDSNSNPTGEDAGAPAPTSPEDSGAANEDATDGTDASDAGANEAATDAAVDAPSDGGSDASSTADAGPVVNGCTAADYALHDESGANDPRAITFAKAAPATQYAPNCMEIAKGQSVTWTGDFKLFPLDPLGGDTPTPIKKTNKGATVTFTFAAAGTYGFSSSADAKVMFGAIEVTP